ncbi:GPI transamidase component PIG-S [Talaromyces islandicus]|uniref:GPI transamidase component PIG-S n=1 Tax=Talaromyces islandicus TaxID=28573 RepID=A0A0U1M4V9_TALIS|nr:GPI transamidase component PIG-S [Talaromyces islandicus]
MVRYTVSTVVALQLGWSSLVTAASLHAIHLSDLFSRADSCATGYNSCGSPYPSDFCCPSSTKCLGLDSGSSVLCCPTGSDCTYIQPITCDIQAQNATADASANVKTTRLSDQLETCGDACCPFGYSCAKNSTCVLDKSTSSEASTTVSGTGATTAPTTLATTSPTATATVSLSVPTSTTVAAVSSALSSTTTEAQVSATCQEFPAKAVIAGFFPGLISGALGAAIISLCRRKSKSKEMADRKAQNISPRPPIEISDPIPADENSFYRTDFLLQRFSGRYPSNQRSKSVLQRTGTRVKSFFGATESPQWNSASPPPPMPTHIPVTPPQQTSRPGAREPSMESIKVYSPPNMINTSPALRPGAARTVQQERPQTTFSEVMEKVGFQNSQGDPYYRVTETPAPGEKGGASASEQPAVSNAADSAMNNSSNTAMPKAAAVVSHALPAEKKEAVWTRTKVILSFWAVIIFLGLPVWWKTTSIYRASLPLEEMMSWAEGRACKPEFPLEILLRTPSIPLPEAQNLLRTTQHALDDLNEFPVHHLRLKLAEQQATVNERGQELKDEIGGRESPNTALVVNLVPQEIATPKSELHSYSPRLDIFYPPNQLPSATSSNSPLVSFIADEIQKLYIEEKATIAHILRESNIALPSSHAPGQSNGVNSIPPELTELVSTRVAKSLKYAETYHLSFSLFTPGSQPSSWEIEDAIESFMAPVLNAFSPISNFSVNTQVQLYASFSPTSPLPEFDEITQQWTLKQEDLSAFINAAEWPLSPSIGSGPTINFVLYVPAPTQSPLVIKENQATSWIVPQWGGVTIVNPPLATTSSNPTNPPHLSKESLKPALLTFSHQLLTLLGTPATPSSLPLRLQTLIRIRAALLLLSASSTMGSLARLTQSLASIPVPVAVASSVSTTLSHLSSTCQLLREGKFTPALASARIAENAAEKSFFEKSMVGQMYFPDEHKVAVYLPLLGPIGVPLVIGLLREVKRVVTDLKQKKSR